MQSSTYCTVYYVLILLFSLFNPRPEQVSKCGVRIDHILPQSVLCRQSRERMQKETRQGDSEADHVSVFSSLGSGMGRGGIHSSPMP